MPSRASRYWTIPVLALVLLSLAGDRAEAAAKKALFVTIDGGYNADGLNMLAELNARVSADYTDGLVDHVVLNADGRVATQLAQHTYEQIWIYDLSTGADDYPTDYAAIVAWYQQAPVKEVICDGRFLSSFWAGRSTTEGRALTANYFYNLDIRGGGLVLATDHNEYANLGINRLNELLGFGPFVGNFGGSFPLDAGHPLTTEPNTLTGLANDSTTGQAPFGVQTNGRTLRTIGYHSGVATNPGISTTIDGGLLGITVEIDQSGGVLCEGTRAFTASITSGAQFGPFSYEWRVNNAVVGTGVSYTFDASAMSAGSYEVQVIAQGAGARADDDVVTMTVGGAACGCGFDAQDVCDDGGAVFVIGLDGPVSGMYALCRVVPAGSGTPPATSAEFRCEDNDNDGVIDLIDADTLMANFGVGFCGMP